MNDIDRGTAIRSLITTIAKILNILVDFNVFYKFTY